MATNDAGSLSSSSTQNDGTEDSSSKQSGPLFQLVNVDGRITLDNVYQNGLHALKRLEIRNLVDHRILIKLRSNLRNQIAFQLENENIIDAADVDLATRTATNSVEWAQAKDSRDYHCNQIFNYVNHIDQLELAPLETCSFILAFLPETDQQHHGAQDSDADAEPVARDDAFALSDSMDEAFKHTKRNITGSLFFFGYLQQDDENTHLMEAIEDREKQDASPALAAYQLSVKFRASVCQSVLWTDVMETGLNFDDCKLGETYQKEFAIQNKSDIDLYWLLNTVDLSNMDRQDWLRFCDAETGEPLENEPLPPYSSRTIKVVFLPKEVGEFNYDLQLENANDSRNVIQTRVHASVRSVLREESLVVSSGNALDFGDCISGSWTMRQIVLNNVSESPIEVRFIPESAEVVFDMKSDLDTATAESKAKPSKDMPIDMRGRLLAAKHTSEKSAHTSVTPSIASTSEMSTANSEGSSRASSPIPQLFGGVRTPSIRNEDSNYFPDADGTYTETGRAIAAGPSQAIPPNSAGSYTRIEDLVIRPGKERVIQVSYRPRKDASVNDFNAGQLIRRNFRVVLEYGSYRSSEPKEKKAIQCRARTCTSFVEAIPKDINFGDTDVGTLKSLPVNIYNRSDIVARVELQFTSKVLNCLRGEIVIQPRSYVELKLDLYPRKVNPEYRKQITLVNFLNRDNDQIIEVRSTNIDKNRVTFHSLFYRILTATGANFLDFGSIVLNSPAIRTFTVENIRNARLRLEITTSMPDDLIIYTKKRRTDQPSIQKPFVKQRGKPVNGKDERDSRPSSPLILPKGPRRRDERHAHVPTHPSSHDERSTAYLDLAVTPSSRLAHQKRKRIVYRPGLVTSSQTTRLGKKVTATPAIEKAEKTRTSEDRCDHKAEPHREDSFETDKSKRSRGITAARYKSRKNMDWSDIAGKSRVPFEDLISVLEHGSKAPTPLFPKHSSEERFVRQQLAWRRELDRLIEKGDLMRTSIIDVDALGEEEVVIVFTPNGATKPHIKSAPKKQDARIFLRLVDFDRNMDQTEFENLLDLDQSQIPVREVIVRAQLSRSVMDLGQKNINFGLVERNERHSKSIVLHNRSETALLYTIRKSGSIASGDIVLGAGRYGVVRAFGKREIDFAFEPTLAGPFLERLVVENIRDRTNDRVLSLKAMVRKPSTFFIKSLELAFGPCLVDQVCSRVETIVLTNTNKQSRLFEVRVDPNEANFGPYYAEFDFVVEDDASNTLTKEAEEEIENLEQKLKIARRKEQPDKIKKYLKKLAKLKNLDKDEGDGEGDTKKDEGAVKESPIIFKKTAESVVFPLDPNATKTISVHFKPTTRPVQLHSAIVGGHATARFAVKGQILAHEYKNTDACKHIVYSATLCEDEDSYRAALEAEHGDASNELDIKNQNIPAETTLEDEAQPEPLKLERSYFDGGKVEVDQKSTFYVRVTNDSDEPLFYDIILDDSEKSFFICPETTEPLGPKEVRKLMFEILPTVAGKQQHTLCIRNRSTLSTQTFTLQCLVHLKSYLTFPSLSEDNQGELDLGYSYVDPGSKYSQVTPLLVQNISGQDIFIKCQSNLTHQVLIFVDESGERGLVDMIPFKQGSMTTVWVAVQPNLLTSYLGSSSADECRELVGGIKFSVYTPDTPDEGEEEDSGMLLMHTQTVKFVSIIGQSHLEVSHKVINLGYTDLLQEEFYGTFTIKNKSEQLPLDYEVECPSGNILLDRRGGTLDGWRGTSVKNDSPLDYLDQKHNRRVFADGSQPISMAQITFRISAYRYGLLSEKLIITNKHNSQEVFEVEVRFFVDCQRLRAWSHDAVPLLQNTSHEEQIDAADHREANPLPVVQWDSIYVCPVQTAETNKEAASVPPLQVMSLLDEEEARLYVKEIEVANTSDEAMELIALSEIDITAGWMADEDQVRMTYLVEEGAYLQRSGQLILQPGARVRVRLHCPSAEKLDEYNRSMALLGRSGALKGMLVLYDQRQQLEVLAVELEALFSMSLADLAVDRIDLGQIGHTASWKPVEFKFTVRNLADVPLLYDIQAPEYMTFRTLRTGKGEGDDENDEGSGNPLCPGEELSIPARKSQVVRGVLDPREMRDQTSGLRRIDVRIVNHHNKNNVAMLKLKTMMTVFELCFERLENGTLVLPELSHPIAAANIPCDNWFAVRNTTDDDIRFEIGADMAAGLEDYVKLDVLSRYTNTPLRGGITVSAQGSMEIRVRASSNENSRLPRADWIVPEGITLAKLWVTTRPSNDEILREVIPVRSILVEAPIFTLSERRLDFNLVTYYKETGVNKTECDPESLPLTILNHATRIPLRFQVTIEGPAEFPSQDIVRISPLGEDRTGMVAPGGALTLTVAIANPQESIPGQFRIHVNDLDAVGQIRQTASIYVNETVWDL